MNPNATLIITTLLLAPLHAAETRRVVEVLKGLPGYDGMRRASAHAWDLATGRLKRF